MITQKIKKLKKYLFFISVIFFVLTLSHLTYSYLYINSRNLPVKGGTISEGIVGKFPSLNPIVPHYDDNEKYILGLLYRSILRYDINSQKFVGDIANCDISSLVNIQCIINEDAKWSDGENITAEDISSTYQLIKETNSNKILISLLQDTDIETKDNVIIFKNKRKDVNFLNVFLQPILKKSFIDTLSEENITGDFPMLGGVYSGKFVIDKVSEDENIGITKLTLDKNKFYSKSNISKIILNFFPDINSLKKNYQAVNVFNDYDNNIGSSIPRFQDYKYSLNSFFGLFLNQNKIKNPELRNYILSKIDTEKLLNVIGEENYELASNPFLTKETISKEPNNKNFDSIMSSIGYKKKSSFTQDILPKIEENKPKEEEKENTGADNEPETKELKIPKYLSIDRYQKKSKTIFSPSYVDLYNFVTKDDILLKGKNPNNVENVYINDYKLANFKPGFGEFYYRLKESFNNLKPGLNNYKIYFVIGGKKELQEEINFVYYSDRNKLKEEEKRIATELYKKEFENKNENKSVTVDNSKEKENTEKRKVEERKNKDLLEKINKLDENLYYDKDFKELTLNLYYLNDGKKETTDTVNFIENSIKELGIVVNSTPFSVKDLPKIISSKDDYDMFLTGVHLGYLKFNIFPYLHSSQAKAGYNFSNIRKTSLDLLVEELKENIYSDERTKEVEDKVIEILKNEQVLKTLYVPKVNLLIDKTVKLEKPYTSLPYKSERSEILEKSYIKEERIINFKDKSLLGFFKFTLQKLYE